MVRIKGDCRYLIFVIVLLMTVCKIRAQTHTIKKFPLSSVRLLPSPFQSAQSADLKYILALEPDRLLAPYLREAKLKPLAQGYGNWEATGLDGHVGGHYLSALSLMYAASGNAELKRRLDYMIDWLEKCQQSNGNGYVGGIPNGMRMWDSVAGGHIQANGFSLNSRWVPLYNLHKLFAGLVDAHLIGGSNKAKEILVKLSDWLLNVTSGLTDDQIQEMLRSEHGGMNEALADAATITGDKRYLSLARRFSHKRILNPLLEHKDQLTGLHANTQIPKVIGFVRLAQETGDTAWAGASDFFWNTVVNNRSVSIGGNSVREHFHSTSDFSSMIESREGPETCNSYNMLKLTGELFKLEASGHYIDYYERTLYNHILSSQHPKGGFVYFTPMRPRHYRVYSQPSTSFWCCVGSGLENHAKYGELIYARDTQNLYVNLFIPSVLDWKDKKLTVTQTTKFPFAESSTLMLKLDKPAKLGIKVRYPSWIGKSKMEIRINNVRVASEPDTAGYVLLFRRWKTGDVISLKLPMEARIERLPDQSSWVSFAYGPIVLAAATDTTDLVGLRASEGRMAHIAHGELYPIEGAPFVVSTTNIPASLKPVKGKPLTFTAPALLHPKKYQALELKPFFQIHDARYVVYWPVTTPDEVETKLAEFRRHEAARLEEESKTIDQIAVGQQQPESDHQFSGEQTESGVSHERQWRRAKGWFSYKLTNKENQARKIRITFSGVDSSGLFRIYLNDVMLAETKTERSAQRFYDVDYAVPRQLIDQNTGTLEIKFVPTEGAVTARVFHIRLMK